VRILRAPWFMLAAVVVSIVGVSATFLALLFPRRRRLQRVVLGLWGRGIARAAGVRLTRSLPDALPDGACVVAPNHASMLDICVVAGYLPVDLRFVSRPFFFKVPVLGWGMAVAGHVALDPKRPREAARRLASLERLLAGGTSVVLFPEGTRSADGRVSRYKRGPFLTAIRNGIPLLPVYLGGLHAVLPRDRLVARPGRAVLVVGTPIPTTGLAEADAGALARRVEEWAREREAEHDAQAGAGR